MAGEIEDVCCFEQPGVQEAETLERALGRELERALKGEQAIRMLNGVSDAAAGEAAGKEIGEGHEERQADLTQLTIPGSAWRYAQ